MSLSFAALIFSGQIVTAATVWMKALYQPFVGFNNIFFNGIGFLAQEFHRLLFRIAP